MREATAFSPSHITGIFEIFDKGDTPLHLGSRGAGLSLTRGVVTKVTAHRCRKNKIRVSLNGEMVEAPVSATAATDLIRRTAGSWRVDIQSWVGVPIGCGYGSSGAGALSVAFAMNRALELELPREEVGAIAHVADVRCRTGLGTVLAEFHGGIEVRTKPGAPGIGSLKRIQGGRKLAALSISLGPISTSQQLSDPELRIRVNQIGRECLRRLQSAPSVTNLMKESRRFTQLSQLLPSSLWKLLPKLSDFPHPWAMAMLGRTLFTVVQMDEVDSWTRRLKVVAPPASVIVSEIDTKGARLLP